MTDNPVAEIIARALAKCDNDDMPELWETEAHAIIAALEGAGWKILFREPTKEMLEAGGDCDDGGYWPARPSEWKDMFDAAPSWAGNKKALWCNRRRSDRDGARRGSHG
jgi:hypothetical protein